MFDLFKCAYFRWPGWNSWCSFWKWEIFWWWFTTCLPRSWKVGYRYRRIPGQFVISLPFLLLFVFCCVCIFCSRVFLFLPLRCLFLGRKILMGIMELKAVLSFRVAWLKLVYHILIWTVFLQIGLEKPPSIL